MIRACLAVLLLGPGAADALELELPAGAELTAESSDSGAALLPAGAAKDGTVPLAEYSGHVSRQAWRIAGMLTSFQLLEPLKAQLEETGYRIVESCETRGCGGFDFRFGIEVIPEPAMHVDLGDFRYLLAQRETPEGTEAVSLLISTAGTAGYVQIVAVEPGEPDAAQPNGGVAVVLEPDSPGGKTFDPGSLVARLERDGHVVLDDLAFDSGSSTLGDGSYGSLEELAAYLKENPKRTVAVVGHTDAVGGLAANVVLSRARAESVRERLVSQHGVARDQVTSDGVGFLSPRASNLTEEGRERNRRVEAVLTSTE